MPTPLDPELVDQIRESLYAGRGVRLFGDEPPVARLDPSTPITAEGEAFLDGKLAKVAELLDRGFIVNIDSDGSILARTPDSGSRYISTQESDIDAMDRIMVKAALEQGATVAFEADGSLLINASATPTTVPAATVAAQFEEFERMADSGQIGTELAAGRDFQFDASAVVAPVVPAPLEDPFDTAAEVEAEAASLQLGVDVARSIALPDYITDKQEAEAQRMAAERQLAMTTAERDAAQKQVAAAQAEATSAAQFAESKRAEAATLRASGNIAEADAAQGDADSFDAIVTAQTQIAGTAQSEFDDADARQIDEMVQVDLLTVASQEVNEKYSQLEGVLGAQESQVYYARAAAGELAEVERLEAAVADMEARGVPGLDRVRSAIEEHRAAAERYVEKGELRSTTDVVVTGDDAVEPDVIDPSVDPSMPQPDPTDPDPTDPDPTDPDPTDPDVIDPDQSDMDPVDPGVIFPDPIYPTATYGAPTDPDVIQMGDEYPRTATTDDTTIDDTTIDDTTIDDTTIDDTTIDVDLDVPAMDEINDSPQFEERVDDINELEADLDNLTD